MSCASTGKWGLQQQLRTLCVNWKNAYGLRLLTLASLPWYVLRRWLYFYKLFLHDLYRSVFQPHSKSLQKVSIIEIILPRLYHHICFVNFLFLVCEPRFARRAAAFCTKQIWEQSFLLSGWALDCFITGYHLLVHFESSIFKFQPIFEKKH